MGTFPPPDWSQNLDTLFGLTTAPYNVSLAPLASAWQSIAGNPTAYTTAPESSLFGRLAPLAGQGIGTAIGSFFGPGGGVVGGQIGGAAGGAIGQGVSPTPGPISMGTGSGGSTITTNGQASGGAIGSNPFAGMDIAGWLRGLGGGGSTSGGVTTTGNASWWSDRRLKRDIIPLDIEYAGVPWYRFRYVWSSAPQIGVMHDEVVVRRPEAASSVAGVGLVNYDTLLGAAPLPVGY